jgi:collagenase-like PrtC family protease
MKLSVAYSFQDGLLDRLSALPDVKEIYGCCGADFIGSGRSAYTLRSVPKSKLGDTIVHAHAKGIAFNYLLNTASLYGIEQTRSGQRAIRRTLDNLMDVNVDAVTVAAPLLLRIIKKHYPGLRVRVGAFALIDNATKAKLWQESGADTLCISAISCNRNFERLQSIRAAVTCELELIANASCLPGCIWEQTHMHLLSQSSTKNHALKGFCLDYCFVKCSQERLKDPVNYIRSIWIRPEDLSMYENIGYHNFKIVERSCPADLLLRRVEAYCSRRFDGNLWELIAPVAWVKREQKVSWHAYARMMSLLARPWLIKTGAILDMKKFAETIIPHRFSREEADVYIDNKELDAFLSGFLNKAIKCDNKECDSCGYCMSWAKKSVLVRKPWQETALAISHSLDDGVESGSHWGL